MQSQVTRVILVGLSNIRRIQERQRIDRVCAGKRLQTAAVHLAAAKDVGICVDIQCSRLTTNVLSGFLISPKQLFIVELLYLVLSRFLQSTFTRVGCRE